MPSHHEKNTYRTYREALRVLLRSSRSRGTALRIYPCSECHGFHLTKERRA